MKVSTRFFTIGAVVSICLFFSGVSMAISEPKYTVQLKKEDYEIRLYAKTVVAQTRIEGSFDEAGSKAFRILADYIFGNNKSKTKVAMTAPVVQQHASEKIAMTAPVSQIKDPRGYLVQFTMPEGYNLENLPEPNDKRVQLIDVPARRVAVYSYSGSWSESRFNEKLESFKLALTRDNLVSLGEPIFARFNSPFQIWFLRRNEIWQAIAL